MADDEIKTKGGAYVKRDVNAGGDFVGRDKTDSKTITISGPVIIAVIAIVMVGIISLAVIIKPITGPMPTTTSQKITMIDGSTSNPPFTNTPVNVHIASTANPIPLTATSLPSTDTPAPASSSPSINLTPLVSVAESSPTVSTSVLALQDNKDRVGAVYNHISHFWIMNTQVTYSMYKQCVASNACSKPDNNLLDDPSRENTPVTNVDYNQAVAYTAWIGGRLPTNEEWEEAACQNSVSIHFLDNVWEWTDTLYTPNTNDDRILRGGPEDNDCNSPSSACTTGWDKPTQKAWCRGFRVVIDKP